MQYSAWHYCTALQNSALHCYTVHCRQYSELQEVTSDKRQDICLTVLCKDFFGGMSSPHLACHSHKYHSVTVTSGCHGTMPGVMDRKC